MFHSLQYKFVLFITGDFQKWDQNWFPDKSKHENHNQYHKQVYDK